MGTLRTPSLGKLLSLLGYDGTDFSVLKCDSSGRLLALVGYDGSTYRPIATDANGQPKVLISGTVPDADKLDGYHAADFLKLAGGTMIGKITLDGDPTADLHAVTKQYADALAGSYDTIFSPRVAPASPSAYDDEFDNGAVGAGLWTTIDPGGVLTVTEGDYGLLLLAATAANTRNAGVFTAIPAGDFTIDTHIALSGRYADSLRGGIALWENAAGAPSTCDMWSITLQFRAATVVVQVNRWSQYDTFVVNLATVTDQIAFTDLWLRVRRAGTTYYWDYSTDGIGYVTLYQGTMTFVPAEIGPVICNVNSGISATARFGFWRYRNTDVGVITPTLGRNIKVFYA